MGVQHAHTVAESRIDHRRVRTDGRALADDGVAVELRARLDHGVGADHDADVDARARRLDDRHTGEHVAFVDAPLRLLAHGCEPGAVVDPEQHRGILDAQRGDVLLARPQQRDHVGQVELALRVGGADLGERVEQRAGVEGVDAGVDLVDRELMLARVAGDLRLDDPLDGAVRAAHERP